MKTAQIAIAAMLSLAFSAAPSFARDVTVSYSDLDLQTAQGRATLERRLEAAARAACEGTFTTTGTLLPNQAQRKCMSMARRQSREQLAQILQREGLGG